MKKVSDFFRKYGLLPTDGVILCAVSGGADSMCLLHHLRSSGYSVCAAHYNHSLRGAESDADEEFVRRWCDDNGIAFYAGRGDVAAFAAENGLGTEDAARQMRYAFLTDAAEKCGAKYIATAHNADDNAETVLLNMTRGSGTRGLCGIPPVRGNIIRPMLAVTRAEIDEYLAANGIPHREDSSNAGDDYSRNRVRHRVMPTLREINPAVSENVSSMTELLRRDDDYLASLAQNFIDANRSGDSIPAASLAALPYPVASRAVRMMCARSITARNVADVLALAASANPSAALTFGDTAVRREYENLVFASAPEAELRPVPLDTDGETLCGGYRFICKKAVNDGSVNKSFNTFLLKCDNLHGVVMLRARKAGDSICLSPRGGTKSLHRLFIDAKVPAVRRELIPLVTDDAGIAAIPGFGQDVRTFPSAGDKIIICSVEEIEK